MADSIQKAVGNHIQNLGVLTAFIEGTLGVTIAEASTRGSEDGEVYVTLLQVDDRSSEQAVLAAATSLGALLVIDEDGLQIGIRAPLWVEAGEDVDRVEAHSKAIYAALAERVHGGAEEGELVH